MKYEQEFEEIWEKVRPFTMTSKNRGYGLYSAVNYVLDNNIPGSFVECGVWRGGSAMIIALSLRARGVDNRRIILFDTFEGMTAPTTADVDWSGKSAERLLAETDETSLMHAKCDLKTVRKNMVSTGYPRECVGYVAGDIGQTLPTDRVKRIGLLRLDTDFYDSTLAALTHLYPLVADDGIVIIDDYGHWMGAQQATDEFLEKEKAADNRLFLAPLDYTGRIFAKPGRKRTSATSKHGDTPPPTIDRYDYQSPGLENPRLLAAFDSLVQADPTQVKWKYLRSDIPHIWRNDARSLQKNIGVQSLDEAVLLYNAALPFRGKRGLEIGCHFGFSTAHLVHAGLALDVIDPGLGKTAQHEAVANSLEKASTDGTWTLHAGFSPQLLETVFKAGGEVPWSFAFIDGNHDGPYPENDARAVADYLDETAAVMFHDLSSPDVADGLRAFKDLGWKTRVYETMQVMGIAWRGEYSPPEHVADPLCDTASLTHLDIFR